MDFDRNAIGSLEDLQREWDGLENERSQVEERLRRFETSGRGGGPGRRGGWKGGGGGGGIGGRNDAGGRGHGGQTAAAGDWYGRDNNSR